MKSSRGRVLFVSEAATLAHVVRPMLLASALEEGGYDVYFACDTYYDAVTGTTPGRRIRIRSRSPQDFEATLQAGGELFSAELLKCYIEEEQSLLAEVKPDIVVSDLRLSLSVSARLAQIPLVTLASAYWSPYISDRLVPFPCLGVTLRHLPRNFLGSAVLRGLNALNKVALPSVLRKQGAGLNAVRAAYHLPEFEDYFEGFSCYGDHTVFADAPELVPCTDLPPSCRFIGPLCWSPRAVIPEHVERILKGSEPFVFISLGSSGNQFALEAILQATSSLRLPAIVASAHKNVVKIAQSFERIAIAPLLPGDLIAKQASLVVTNGGSPSTYQALMEGSPVLGIPANMDQLIFMQTAARSGAVRELRADQVSVPRAARVLRECLEDRTMSSRARALQEDLTRWNAPKSFSLFIDDLLQARRLSHNVA